MDLYNQQRVKDAAAVYGTADILVILGTSNRIDAANFAETLTDGDQSYTGPLAWVSLRLPIYHMLDPLVKAVLDPDAWQRHIAVLEKRMDGPALAEVVARKRLLYGTNVL